MRPWSVMKFGGTSVGAAAHWDTIAAEIAERLPRRRVLVVCSALAKVTNLLQQAIDQAAEGSDPGALETVAGLHRALAADLGLPAVPAEVDALLAEAAQRVQGIRLTGEASPRLRARIMGVGELASTRLAVAALSRAGIDARWVDVRDLLVSRPAPRETDHRRYLEARIPTVHDPETFERVAGGADVVVTQGFIARTPDGETCLVGRGGSDTSGALLAALAGAAELEIWTDVPGLFSADPNTLPAARLIRRAGYNEARELASLGANVLHPRCIDPVAAHGIPLSIRCTPLPGAPQTRIEPASEDHPAVTAVTCRSGGTLVTISTMAMWDRPGFLAQAFAPFEELGISIDLVGTSQASVSVTLDRLPGGVEGRPFSELVERLQRLGEVSVVHPCAVVSVVGRRIRTALPDFAEAFGVFRDRPVHLVTNSSEDLNLSFVVDEADGPVLVERLHARLISSQGDDPRFGPTWQEIRRPADAAAIPAAWWEARRDELCALVADGAPRYVYDLPTIASRARALRAALTSVDGFFYSIKANPHPLVLETIAASGFGLECVSRGEIERVREVLGASVPILFTPNFCPIDEYRAALEAGAEVTVDGVHVLEAAPSLFRGVAVGVRMDPGFGLGHHEKVRTGGAQSKFGCPASEFDALLETCARIGARVAGLHAHVGSGILDPGAWAAVGASLASLAERLPDAAWIDVGGGLGVPERPGQPPLDLAAVERGLAPLRRALGRIALRLEPGRYLVAEAGVLVTPVTQVRRKGDTWLVGTATGMNSLIRPALYGAWHPVWNLARLHDAADARVNVVGPICESGDVLARDRWLPLPRAGDVLLVGCAGAYGAAMSSRYNLRPPAEEVALR